MNPTDRQTSTEWNDDAIAVPTPGGRDITEEIQQAARSRAAVRSPRPRHTTPTKQQELAILDRAIDHLGPQSYLAPWLSQVKAEVERDIRSDIFPSISLADAREQAAAIIAEAHAQATVILDAAQKGAAAHRTQAYTSIVAARQAVETASRDLERVAGWVQAR